MIRGDKKCLRGKKRKDKEVIVVSDRGISINMKNCVIRSSYNYIFGEGLVVHGKKNIMILTNSKVNGNHNTVSGRGVFVNGNSNEVDIDNSVLFGSYNRGKIRNSFYTYTNYLYSPNGRNQSNIELIRNNNVPISFTTPPEVIEIYLKKLNSSGYKGFIHRTMSRIKKDTEQKSASVLEGPNMIRSLSDDTVDKVVDDGNTFNHNVCVHCLSKIAVCYVQCPSSSDVSNTTYVNHYILCKECGDASILKRFHNCPICRSPILEFFV